MYIRVKRSKTTYFLQCDPTETILEIKQKLLALIDQPVSDQRLILVGTGEVLDDSKTLADQKVLIHFSVNGWSASEVYIQTLTCYKRSF